MATEPQIKANRANAAKSTGPVTPEGKRSSSQNASNQRLLSGAVVPKGESPRRYNHLAADLILQFQPRNSAEIALIQTMALARWNLSSTSGIQTAGFRRAMTGARKSHPTAAAFRSLAESSRSFARRVTIFQPKPILRPFLAPSLKGSDS